MIAELTAALILSIRCGQACLDEGFSGGTHLKKICRCYTDLDDKVMLNKLLVIPEMALDVKENEHKSEPIPTIVSPLLEQDINHARLFNDDFLDDY